jgi:hypothetical protein
MVRINNLFSFDKTQTAWKGYVKLFIAARTCSSSRYLVTMGVYADRPTYSPFIRHGPYNNYASNNSFIVACNRCHGNVSTEPLPSNDVAIHIQTHRLIRGIYEVRRWDGFKCHDIRTNLAKNRFRHSRLIHHEESTSLFLFFKNKENRLIN